MERFTQSASFRLERLRDRLGRRWRQVQPAPRFDAAGLTFLLPSSCRVKLSSDPESRDAVAAFVLSSPDHTLYHLEPYLAHLRGDDGIPADLALILRHGAPVFALPLHHSLPTSGLGRAPGVSCDHGGPCFPDSSNESILKQSVEALGEFLSLNRDFVFEIKQGIQGASSEHPARMTFIERYFDELGLATQPIYSRLLELDAAGPLPSHPGRHPRSESIEPEELENGLIAGYKGDLRNQIRQGLRKGLTVSCFWGDRARDSRATYELIQPLHTATWGRSGSPGHTLGSRLGQSVAVNAVEGATDLVVVVADADGNPVADAVCHIYRNRAFYWAGDSLESARELRANPVCLHAAISLCQAAGVRYFEFGRFRVNERSDKERAVTAYKSQFGGVLVPVLNFQTRPSPRGRLRIGKARVRMWRWQLRAAASKLLRPIRGGA